MKNIDSIILNSLKLINYDRSKHITEQLKLPTPAWRDPITGKKMSEYDYQRIYGDPFKDPRPEVREKPLKTFGEMQKSQTLYQKNLRKIN